MAEVLLKFEAPVLSASRDRYWARVCGRERDDGLWEGWIEFEPIAGGMLLRSSRETTQPNPTDLRYWATGLTPTYLEGALARALNPRREPARPAPESPAFDGPAPPVRSDGKKDGEAVLDPFSVYEKSPALLAKELRAFRAWHLEKIARVYHLADPSTRLDVMSEPELAAFIVDRVATLERARRRQ
jgi:hypothetical protein